MLAPAIDPFGCGDVDRTDDMARDAAVASGGGGGGGSKDGRERIFGFRADQSYAGSIAVVQRGTCTFEQKVPTAFLGH